MPLISCLLTLQSPFLVTSYLLSALPLSSSFLFPPLSTFLLLFPLSSILPNINLLSTSHSSCSIRPLTFSLHLVFPTFHFQLELHFPTIHFPTLHFLTLYFLTLHFPSLHFPFSTFPLSFSLPHFHLLSLSHMLFPPFFLYFRKTYLIFPHQHLSPSFFINYSFVLCPLS